MERSDHCLDRHPELERLICAAVSNQKIAALLVAEPAHAIKHVGQRFRLSPHEQALVASIVDADDIYDFAARLHAAVRQGQDATILYSQV